MPDILTSDSKVSALDPQTLFTKATNLSSSSLVVYLSDSKKSAQFYFALENLVFNVQTGPAAYSAVKSAKSPDDAAKIFWSIIFDKNKADNTMELFVRNVYQSGFNSGYATGQKAVQEDIKSVLGISN